ncbi:hypothetical protein [Rufibacter sp. XAAS-G3-1]|uniref:hypothetical protein n=1 Tax=Rufibacter sp. XAAS-G3-1 TaxID=2729134 RepID=UPI0015E779BB|nr:hypothetical protein [Rufibacter sp. XAAS-G3-1]
MEEQPIYYPEDAAKIVQENISAELQHKLSFDDILFILEVEFEFLEQSGVTTNPDSIVPLPIEIEDDAMEYYIINQCASQNIYLTFEEVKEILKAEEVYLRLLGLIDEEGMAPFYN